MKDSTSAVLDLVRFFAALLVFFHHSEHQFHSRWMDPLAPFGHDAVVMFFLLSGFVIAHTVRHKDHTIRDFAVARLGKVCTNPGQLRYRRG